MTKVAKAHPHAKVRTPDLGLPCNIWGNTHILKMDPDFFNGYFPVTSES